MTDNIDFDYSMNAVRPESGQKNPPPEIRQWMLKRVDEARLTPKEKQVTLLLLRGLSTKELAPMAGITEKTVKHHIASIFEKFDVDSRAELFAEIFCIYE